MSGSTRGSDAPGVALCVVVAAGLGTVLLDPDTVTRVVTVAHGPLPPVVTVIAWAVGLCTIAVGTVLWWWGPVRVSRAEMTWRLSGPADRGLALAPGRNRAALFSGCGCLATALVVSLLEPGATMLLGCVGVVTAGVLVVAATVHQRMRGTAEGTAGASSRPRGPWSTGTLHRDVIAPDDGLVGAARLATVTMDLDWISVARRVRWQRSTSGQTSRRWPATSSLIAADFVRLWRRRGDLLWWLTLVAVGLAAGSTLVLPTAEQLVATLIAYRAGCVVAGGLRTVATQPALRRVLGGSTRRLYSHHAVVPVLGVVAWASITSMTWHMTPLALVVVTVGAALAVLRRSTRPDLPFDAPVYVLGQGGAVQPLLLLAMARGPMAAVLTGLAATLIN